eukprot:gene10857-12012_t
MDAEQANPIRKFTHAIFDMDGLLIDTERIYSEVMQRVVGNYGKSYTWDLKVKMMGSPGLIAAQVAIDELQLPITAQQYLDEGEVHKNELFPHCNLMPGAEKLLRHLHKHNIPIALASGSATKDFKTKTQRHGDVFSLFKIFVLGDNPEIKHGKPHPDVFLFTASKFEDNPDPRNVLVFEDSPNGVKAGKSANMGVVLVPDERLDSSLYSNADIVLKSLEEFKPEDWGFPPYDS